MDACERGGAACRRRFDQNRMNFFHYLLYAHSRGKPKYCLDGTEAQNAACRAARPDWDRIPSTASGVSDLPGGDSMVTLGGWDHFTGTEFIQASTTMHELGHSFWRTHGGAAPTVTSAALNCKPQYLSVMNYLYQLGGLREEDGTPNLGFAMGTSGVIYESSPGAGAPTNPLRYRIAWYAPKAAGSLPVRWRSVGPTPAVAIPKLFNSVRAS